MIDGNRIRVYATGIARGYVLAAKSAGALALALLAVALISAAVVTPLWFIATRYTTLYTVISICVLAGAVLVPFLIRVVKDAEKRRLFIRRCVVCLVFLVLVVFLYFIALLFAGGSYAAAVPLLILFIAITGLILHGKRPA
ncbi:MAG: hypothetical protein JW852_07330 [Spirochaetales bacterium]|nr:hypothetical protein [Spirochaetales bacterium]